MRKQHRYLLWLFACGMIMACNHKPSKTESIKSGYYWSTTWQTDTLMNKRMKPLQKLYMRFFDVVKGEDGTIKPNATVRVEDALPKGVEIIPVVFIVNDVMRAAVHPDEIADKVWKRIFQIATTNNMGKIKEIQIDCDWTMQTRKTYYAFLTQLHHLAATQGVSLSTTIRLHQLSQPVPPVDKGVLMLYNTGDFKQLDNQQPILAMKDVAPYLRYLSSYELPLTPAYPLFSYRLLFRGTRFIGILHEPADLPILPHDSIVTRRVDVEEVKNIEHTLEDIRPNLHQEIIIYDYSSKHLKQYNDQAYEKIFNPS